MYNAVYLFYFYLVLLSPQSIPPAIVSFLPIILAPAFLNYSTADLLQYYTSETMLLYVGYASLYLCQIDDIMGECTSHRLSGSALLVYGVRVTLLASPVL